ncbi:galactofuranose ABC transporter, permease protein YjfF [Methylobrevis pamukkalensis]|uniref:Inner membrane ABC transporter permease protein YjfF n=1 Tax=Methylobrevis pamukkalensis TaxID=1439726 RepID=A0A1E3H5R1_9HYPH|nr:galactofuranose ABC transporter, permease protein YjfF [Methylobrevis pamukkalensis]ODN71669.1 Inner membrane ABC transporter permease protein YjfF [Methylobrevis pamukkalensis]
MSRRHLPVAVTTAVFLAGFLFCSLQFENFASTRVVMNLLTDNAFLGILAVGMTFVIISGGIDLSVGSVIGFTTIFLALAIGSWGMPPLIAFVLVLAICAAFGATMGALIHHLEMPPFIVTLAGMFLARGAAFLMSTESIPIDAELYSQIASFSVRLPGGGRLRIIAMIMLATFLVGGLLLHFTRFGTNVYALGGSRSATTLMGVRTGPTTIAVYMLSSLLAGLSGIVFSFYTGAGYSLAAVGVELDTIAAVVIGGTLLTGGAGTIFGTFVGLLIMGLIQTYITFDGTLSSWWAKIATGMLLFAFIAFQQMMSGLSGRLPGRLVARTPK